MLKLAIIQKLCLNLDSETHGRERHHEPAGLGVGLLAGFCSSRFSAVEKVLSEDPAGVYSRIGFSKRANWYRHQVEGIAPALRPVLNWRSRRKWWRAPRPRDHVGYFLIGPGLAAFRALVDYKSSWKLSLRGIVDRWPSVFYLFCVAFLTSSPLARRLLRGLHTRFRRGSRC